MNSLQIGQILKNNSKTKRYFRGVYSADNGPEAGKAGERCWKLRLPCKEKHFPYCFVANTDPVGTSGTHWIAIFIHSPNHVEYFDSFGEAPNDYLKNYLKSFQKIYANFVQLQSTLSDSCGHYCIYFLINRCGAGKTFEQIVLELLRDPIRDLHVKRFVATI